MPKQVTLPCHVPCPSPCPRPCWKAGTSQWRAEGRQCLDPVAHIPSVTSWPRPGAFSSRGRSVLLRLDLPGQWTHDKCLQNFL